MALGILSVALASCAKQGSESQTSTSTPPPAESTATAAPAPTLSDANIAAIVVAANTADIDNGKQGQTRARSADVKAFARQMINDHSASNQQASALATKLGLTPEDNATSTGIRTQQDSIRTAIKSLSGSAFDKAYVDNEVAYHETVLNAIDQALIPNAQNAELKQLLTNTRPIISAHLDHAKQIQAKLGGTATR
jgi:putative membrane protein